METDQHIYDHLTYVNDLQYSGERQFFLINSAESIGNPIGKILYLDVYIYHIMHKNIPDGLHI